MEEGFRDEDAVPIGKVEKGPLSVSKVLKFKSVNDRTGVVYISRIPPYLKPEKVQPLHSPDGVDL